MTNKFYCKFIHTPTSLEKKLVYGFTLIELMVTVSIVGIIMAVVLFNYSKFNDRLSLSGAAQEMTITIRQAQVYGLNTKEASAGGGQFTSAYGIFIDPTNDPTHYTIFVDATANKKYDVGSGLCGSLTTECIEKDTLRNGVTISAICSGAGVCPPDPSVQMLDITFLRPNPDADIDFIDNFGSIWNGSQPTAKIVLRSPQGDTMSVVVESTGQISIQ